MRQTPVSGRYELEEIIGTGGMSVVYRAWDLKYEREVALKVLRPEFASDEDFVRRFSHEAQAASQMSHPNIVDMYDVGQDGDVRYIVMEYIKGITLKDLIRQQAPIRAQRAVQITLRILAALDHAHRNHIVHRDIKPQNILVDEEGDIKVTDFGIARVINSGTGTIGGNVLGSVHYFSPEQANGLVADAKSDLYSVGVVLYEMLTGEVPFDGETPIAVALKHINEAPRSVQLVNPDVSKGMDEVVMKALNKSSASRYQTAAEMATDLKRAVKMPAGGFVQSVMKVQRAGGRRVWKRLPRRWVRAAALTAAIFAMAALAMYGVYLYQKLQTRIEVPPAELVGLDEAIARLEALGFAYSVDERHSEDIEAGFVIDQRPDAGTLLYPGSNVRLVVSLGKASIMMPRVIDKTRSDAVHELEELGLPVPDERIVLTISEAKPGTVIAQDPPPNTWISPSTAVTITVSGECAPMPNVLGRLVEKAQEEMSAAGFPTEVLEVDSDAPSGTVIGQSVEAGARALLGSFVTLTVSRILPILYEAEIQVDITVDADDQEVRGVLDEGTESETEVYRSKLKRGMQTINLELESYVAGEHALTVYVGSVKAVQKSVLFE